MSMLKDNYIIDRSTTEAERLELQHKCYMSCQGYYVHPDISIPVTGARIAELATGTTIWLREVAAANPAVECHGFDISDIMFPDAASMPSNIQLHLADIKQPFESRWVGYFDFVHIKLIQAAMRKEQWAPLVRNITALLKPGGWLQWGECDVAVGARRILRPLAPLGAIEKSLATPLQSRDTLWRPPPDAANYRRFTRSIMPDDRADAMNYGYMNLDVLMADPSIGDLGQVGSDGFMVDREDDGGEMRQDLNKMALSAIWSMIKAREDAGARIADIDPEEWRTAVMKELELGAYCPVRNIVFTGRKKMM